MAMKEGNRNRLHIRAMAAAFVLALSVAGSAGGGVFLADDAVISLEKTDEKDQSFILDDAGERQPEEETGSDGLSDLIVEEDAGTGEVSGPDDGSKPEETKPEETAELAESDLALGGGTYTAGASKVEGSMQMTASIEDHQLFYDSRDAQKNVVCSTDVDPGSRVTLHADIENLESGSEVTFIWTRCDEGGTSEVIRQVTEIVPDDQTATDDALDTKVPAEGTYAYFCTITVPDKAENRDVDHRFVYVIRNPLKIETKNQKIHIAPYDEDQGTTGEVGMEVVADSVIEGDSFQKNPPYWAIKDQYEGVTTGIVKLKDDPPARLRTKAVIKGVDDDRTSVTCRVSSRYSPDFVYGKRYVKFWINTADHDFTDFKVTKEASIWESGTMERTCSICGYKDVEVIGKLTPYVKKSMPYVVLQKGSTTDLYYLDMANGDAVRKWESSDHGVCTVDGRRDGKCVIRARNVKGRSTVTATLESGLTASVVVRVQKVKVATKRIDGLPDSVKLQRKGRLQLEPVLCPATSQYPVTYRTSDAGVATVTKKGVIRAKEPGKCTVTVSSGSVSVDIPVLVTGIDATKITNVRSKYTVKAGSRTPLSVKLYPAGSTSVIRYRSSDRSVLTVSRAGVIRAKAKGTAKITITAVNLESRSVVKVITVVVQ